jgi:prepilin-type N-terminal cleavage/methylation domain-containing protein
MKKLFLKKQGFTLIEVLLAIAIFAAIALPLMSVFLQSAKTDQAARNVFNANYISQDYIETLDTKAYATALNVPNREAHGNYYLSAKIEPYGNAASMFSSSCVYTHVISLSNGSVLVVLPDGKWLKYTSIPSSISISVSGGSYSFSAGGTTKTGAAAYNQCAVIFNAMKKTSGLITALTLGANSKAIVYCKNSEKGNIQVTGTAQYLCDIITADKSLVHVTTSVYDSLSAAKAMATTEAYISLRNE